jgi:hypothetical protein
VSRPGWTGHSRFDDALGAGAVLEDDDFEEEPVDVFYRRQVGQLRVLLEQQPSGQAKLERDLAFAEHRLAAATIDQHWASGAGDRRLF